MKISGCLVIAIMLFCSLSAINSRQPGLLGSSSINHPGSSPLSINTNARSWEMTELTREMWEDSTWTQSERDVYYYNSQHTRVDSVYAIMPSNSNWDLGAIVYLTYTPDQDYVSHAEYIFISGTERLQWVNKYATYDDQHRLASYKMTRYDSYEEEWNDETRTYFTYNNDNTFQIIWWQAEGNSDPEEYHRLSYTHDDQGRFIVSTWQVSPDSTNWVDDEQLNYTYHPHDTMTGAQLISNYAHQYILNSLQGGDVFTGMITNRLDKQWIDSEWVDSHITTSIYDDSDNLTEVRSRDRHIIMDFDTSKASYAYDDNGNLIQITYQESWDGISWNNVARYVYTWSQNTANEDNIIPAVSSLALKAFPNPFNCNVEMQIVSKGTEPVSIDIYNLKGQLVKSLNANPNQKLCWDGKNNQNQIVSPGMYFFKATQGNDTITKKVLRMH